jgi:hypothetical protein
MQVREVAIPEPTTCFLPDQVEFGEGKEGTVEPRGVEFMVGFEIELPPQALLVPSPKHKARIGSGNPANQLLPVLDTPFWRPPFPPSMLRRWPRPGSNW